jgi:hypothetical protein
MTLQSAPAEGRISVTPRQASFVSWVSDVLLFVVVINLFVQYAPQVIIESFSISILTAVLLKLMLDAILGLERRTSAWFASRQGAVSTILGAATTLLILFLSKFVILAITDIVFGDAVTLGGFVDVVVLILTMILARKGLSLVYRRLGE